MEKKRIVIHRIIWLVILVLNIYLPTMLPRYNLGFKLLGSNCYYEYDSHTGYSDCELVLTFNKSISSGSVVVSFYDSSNNLIDTRTAYFLESGKVVKEELQYIHGNIASYELGYADFYPEYLDYVYILYYFIPFSFILFICSLLLSYKEYTYKGKTISVYAGFYHHTLRVDGVKFDEHNTLASYTPIQLSCTLENGDNIQATISLTNRIALKINNNLFTK